MLEKNEGGLERIIRLTLGIFLIALGYSISGIYWLGYQIPVHPIPCWTWDNFVAHSCMVERGFVYAVVGLIPLLTGLIGWCPLKCLFRIK